MIIDISNHNGVIDFSKVKTQVEGIMIRVGFGSNGVVIDEKFKTNVSECIKHNIDFGFYLYSYATNMKEAQNEVKEYLKIIKDYKPTLPVVIDTEDADGWRGKNGNPSWKLLSDMLIYQLNELEQAGYFAMYYVNKHWYDNLIKVNTKLSSYALWLAHWYIDKPSIKCGLWQYSAKGKIEGIKGDVDLNKMYVDYPSIIKKAKLNNHGEVKKYSIDEIIKYIKELK